MKLEYAEDAPSCSMKVGTFTFTDNNGVQQTADFFVDCYGQSFDADVTARNMEAYNEQFTDEWTRLETLGCKNIKYQEVTHLPIE